MENSLHKKLLMLKFHYLPPTCLNHAFETFNSKCREVDAHFEQITSARKKVMWMLNILFFSVILSISNL